MHLVGHAAALDGLAGQVDGRRAGVEQHLLRRAHDPGGGDAGTDHELVEP